MAKKPEPDKRQPLRPDELADYLLWRYNLGGYDDNIAAWRAATKHQDAGGAAGEDKE